MFEFVNILALLCSLGYTTCDDPTPPPPIIHPSQGTVIEAYCDGTTFVEIVANGDGTSAEFREEKSTQCGYVEPVNPAAGTLLREGCSKDYPGVKWFQYADGEGGTYSEKDTRSVECGWSRPTMDLVAEQPIGDRFDPVRIRVDYFDFQGNPEPWGMRDASSTMGYIERAGRDYILVYGDGRIGDGMLTLGRTDIPFTIEDEPRCRLENGVDCMGYSHRGGNQGFIYYGEDDDNIVEWELGILVYASHREYGVDTPIEILEEWDETYPDWEKYEKKVEQYNEVYAASGVHIRYRLTRLYLAHWHTVGDLDGLARQVPVDVVLGRGTSYPDTCGVARVKTYFQEGRPPSSMSKCDIYTDLHELGHSVGLAHGPENQSNADNGYIFPDFGHGYNDICGTNDDLMSYGYQGYFHSNETLYCTDIFDYGPEGVLAGDRSFSDTAYHLNRVRYDVSLIHNDDYIDPFSPLQKIQVNAQPIPIDIID